MHWPMAVHDPPTGPADDTFLQAPSTASSGRKLMAEIVGGSYGCFPGPLFFSSISSHLSRKAIFHICRTLHWRPRVGCSRWEATPAGSPTPVHRFHGQQFSVQNP